MKKVVVFCASGYGYKVLYSLNPKEYELVAFIDNCEDLKGKYNKYMGRNVVVDSPNNILNYEFDFVLLPIAEYNREMREQLLTLGVDQEKIVEFMNWHENVWFDEERLAMARKCLDKILEEGISGNMAELGVYKGDFAQHLNFHFPNKKLYLFDTFGGFSDRDDHTKDEVLFWQGHFRDANIEVVMNKMTNKENVIIKKGYFPDTAVDVDDEFCFVSLDADLYLPMLNGLRFFYPRLVHGGYIFLHDVYSYNWTGCKKAIDEFCSENNINYVPILDRCGTAIITK